MPHHSPNLDGWAAELRKLATLLRVMCRVDDTVSQAIAAQLEEMADEMEGI